jgi:choline dehydrogenase-like flavoprotein
MRAEGETRVAKFRALVRHAFRPHKVQIIRQAENNERLAHACGTCRFGDDPESSVLDRTNLAHGLGNLYVIDSSFFPSSAGTNPSLTIAANALRVADHILRLAHQGR